MAGACGWWLEVPTLVALILVVGSQWAVVVVEMVKGMLFLPFESEILPATLQSDFAYFDAQLGCPLALQLGSALIDQIAN